MPSDTGLELTYDLSLLQKSEEKWNKSAGLRLVYSEFYSAIRNRMLPGPSLELGSGIGKSKNFLPEIVTSDLIKTPYVDRACSAYEIAPPESGRWVNIIALDVLHHLCRPMDFFASASASLVPGGRIVLMEPAATLGAKVFYRAFHREPIHPKQISPPFTFSPNTPDGTFANMGMAYSLCSTHKKDITHIFQKLGLSIVEIVYRDIFAYPLTGGYSGVQLAPIFVLRAFLSFEKMLPQWLLEQFGLRMLMLIEKNP